MHRVCARDIQVYGKVCPHVFYLHLARLFMIHCLLSTYDAPINTCACLYISIDVVMQLAKIANGCKNTKKLCFYQSKKMLISTGNSLKCKWVN